MTAVAPRDLFVVGTGGLAREMAQVARQVDAAGDRWHFRGFIARDAQSVGARVGTAAIVGDDDWLMARRSADVIVGIGQPELAMRAFSRLREAADRLSFPNVIHPSAIVDLDQVSLGEGNCITAGCIFTTDVRVADFNLFNWNVTVGHDAVIGSGNVVNPGANVSGGVVIGDRILIGTGAQILEGLSVGDGATIGAGAVVTRPVQDAVTVVGVPARQSQAR